MSTSSSPADSTRSPRGGSELAGRGRNRGWLWIPLGVVLALFKVRAFAEVIDHRGSAIALLAVWFAIALLRMRLASVAITAAALFGILASSHSVGRGLAFGAGACVVLMGVFFAVATILLARQGSR